MGAIHAGGDEVDLTMNLPPEPTDRALLDRMQDGVTAIAADLTNLLRYQSPVGAEIDRAAGRGWLARRSPQSRGLIQSQIGRGTFSA